MIIDYIIVAEQLFDKAEIKINSNLEHGYRLYGSPFMANDYFIQAMVMIEGEERYYYEYIGDNSEKTKETNK